VAGGWGSRVHPLLAAPSPHSHNPPKKQQAVTFEKEDLLDHGEAFQALIGPEGPSASQALVDPDAPFRAALFSRVSHSEPCPLGDEGYLERRPVVCVWAQDAEWSMRVQG